METTTGFVQRVPVLLTFLGKPGWNPNTFSYERSATVYRVN